MKTKRILIGGWDWLRGIFILWSVMLLLIIFVRLFPDIIGYCANLLEGEEGAAYWFISFLPAAIFLTFLIWWVKVVVKAKGYLESLKILGGRNE